MWEQGFVDEVRNLDSAGLRDGITARKALGYAQILTALEGEHSMAIAQERTVSATRQFARRQDSWFGRDDSIIWRQANSLTAQDILALGG